MAKEALGMIETRGKLFEEAENPYEKVVTL